MRAYISVLQIAFLVALFAAIGGKAGSLVSGEGSFSVWGAGTGGALAITGVAIAWLFIRKGGIDASISRIDRFVLGTTTVAALGAFVCATLYMYTEEEWALMLLKTLGAIAIICIVLGVIIAWTSFGKKGA